MSYTNPIKNTLDILDLNITFHENCLNKERIKGRICQVFSGTLDYTAQICPHCGGVEGGDYSLGLYKLSHFTQRCFGVSNVFTLEEAPVLLPILHSIICR